MLDPVLVFFGGMCGGIVIMQFVLIKDREKRPRPNADNQPVKCSLPCDEIYNVSVTDVLSLDEEWELVTIDFTCEKTRQQGERVLHHKGSGENWRSFPDAEPFGGFVSRRLSRSLETYQVQNRVSAALELN